MRAGARQTEQDADEAQTAEQTDQDEGLALCLRGRIPDDTFGAFNQLDGLVVDHGGHTRLLPNLVGPCIDESLLLISAALPVSIVHPLALGQL